MKDLRLLEALSRRLSGNPVSSPAIRLRIRRLTNHLAAMAHPHFKAEEKIVFPYLSRHAPSLSAALKRFVQEHGAIRRQFMLCRRLLPMASAIAVSREGLELVRLMGTHVRKEIRLMGRIACLALAGFVFVATGCSRELPRSSDWVSALPAGEIRRKLIMGCTSCHQIGVPVAFRTSSPEWELIIKKMRKIDDDLELALIPDFEPVKIADWLGENARRPEHGRRARLGRALIKEFPAGPLESFYHDMELAGGRAWIADYFGNRLYGVDVQTGDVADFDIPLGIPKGKPGGAHALNVTKDGALWITFTKAEKVARFDPATRAFRIYSGFQKGGNVQYFVLDAQRRIYEDEQGGIYATQFSRENIVRLDPKTGAIRSYPTPRTEWLPEKGVHLYAGVADSRGQIWYTETHGNRLGVLDPKTGKAEEWDMPEKWSGPKRLAIDEDDRLWIPELATGKISVYDARERRFTDQLTLPIPGDYPYAIRRDPRTKLLWVTGSGSDCLYRLDPSTRRITPYRLPRRGAYTRTVSFDDQGNVWTCYASYPNEHTQMPHRSGVIARLTPQD